MGRTITNEMATLMMDMATFTYVNAMKELGVPKEQIMDMVPSIESAVREYLQNHDKEIQELMDKYHDEGGCAEL